MTTPGAPRPPRCDAWWIDSVYEPGPPPVSVLSAHTHECVDPGLGHGGAHRCACGRIWQGSGGGVSAVSA